jgi:hypothetical protein
MAPIFGSNSDPIHELTDTGKLTLNKDVLTQVGIGVSCLIGSAVGLWLNYRLYKRAARKGCEEALQQNK